MELNSTVAIKVRDFLIAELLADSSAEMDVVSGDDAKNEGREIRMRPPTRVPPKLLLFCDNVNPVVPRSVRSPGYKSSGRLPIHTDYARIVTVFGLLE